MNTIKEDLSTIFSVFYFIFEYSIVLCVREGFKCNAKTGIQNHMKTMKPVRMTSTIERMGD
jgi:hypothetical protein